MSDRIKPGDTFEVFGHEVRQDARGNSSIVRRGPAPVGAFQPGERVRYRNVNLWDRTGSVVSSAGQKTMVRWDAYPNNSVPESTANLERYEQTKDGS